DRLFERTVIARAAPPLQREGLERFVSHTDNGQANDGRKGAAPGAEWRAPNVKVIAQPLQLPAMTAPPPLQVVAKARDSKAEESRAKTASKKTAPQAKVAAAKKPAPQAAAAKSSQPQSA